MIIFMPWTVYKDMNEIWCDIYLLKKKRVTDKSVLFSLSFFQILIFLRLYPLGEIFNWRKTRWSIVTLPTLPSEACPLAPQASLLQLLPQGREVLQADLGIFRYVS